MAKKRKVRRVQYFPEMVVSKVLSNDFLRSLVYLVYTSKVPVGAGELARQLNQLLSRDYSPGYVSVYLKRLEKWGVVRPYKDPVSGHLLWWPTDSRVAEMLKEEFSRYEVKKILQSVEEM